MVSRRDTCCACWVEKSILMRIPASLVRSPAMIGRRGHVSPLTNYWKLPRLLDLDTSAAVLPAEVILPRLMNTSAATVLPAGVRLPRLLETPATALRSAKVRLPRLLEAEAPATMLPAVVRLPRLL